MKTCLILLALSAPAAPPQTSGPPPELAQAFAEINRARAQIRRPPFLWSPKLARSAQELTDWGWVNYHDSSADAHHDLNGRLARAGVRGRASECGIGGDTDGRGDDGKVYPKDSYGWRHPYRTALNHARETVYAVATSPEARSQPDEGHVRDFRGAWTHVGVGWTKGMFVIDYGNE